MKTIEEVAKNIADSHTGYIRVLDLEYHAKIEGFDTMDLFRAMVKYEQDKKEIY